jgi:hypothetical protein
MLNNKNKDTQNFNPIHVTIQNGSSISTKHYNLWVTTYHVWRNAMNSQCVTYDNYDDFQHVNFIFSHKDLFHYL